MITNESDLLIVFGASFSDHTGIAPYKPIIQVDADPMALGRFHPVTVPVLGEGARTADMLLAALSDGPVAATDVRADDRGAGLNSAAVFHALSNAVDDNAVIAVDVGNDTYSFGRYFECRRQSILMSGYLGSIGFGVPAAMGARAACTAPGVDPTQPNRQIVAVCGDGELGQYLAELTTLAKYGMNITIVVLDNSQLGKISKEQRAAAWDVWQTSLVNPSFAAVAQACRLAAERVTSADNLDGALRRALEHRGPALVEIHADADLI